MHFDWELRTLVISDLILGMIGWIHYWLQVISELCVRDFSHFQFFIYCAKQFGHLGTTRTVHQVGGMCRGGSDTYEYFLSTNCAHGVGQESSHSQQAWKTSIIWSPHICTVFVKVWFTIQAILKIPSLLWSGLAQFMDGRRKWPNSNQLGGRLQNQTDCFVTCWWTLSW